MLLTFDKDEIKLPRLFIVQSNSEILADPKAKGKLSAGCMHIRDHPTIDIYTAINNPVINIIEWHSIVLIQPMVKNKAQAWVIDDSEPVQFVPLSGVSQKDLSEGIVIDNDNDIAKKYTKLYSAKVFLNNDFNEIIQIGFKGYSYWKGGKDLNTFLLKSLKHNPMHWLQSYSLNTKSLKTNNGIIYHYEVTPKGENKKFKELNDNVRDYLGATYSETKVLEKFDKTIQEHLQIEGKKKVEGKQSDKRA